MSGKIIQLVAFGYQDDFISKDPEITFFKIVFKNHTNFSIETMRNTFDGNVDFGNKVNCVVKKNGDLIGFSYIEVTLPALETNGSQVSYCNRIGFRLLKEIELKIGGRTIDKHTSSWLLCWSELSMSQDKKSLLDDMVGINRTITPDNFNNMNTEISNYNINENITLNIPLFFSFCKHPSLAIPLCALKYQNVEISVDLESFNNCLTTGTNNPRGVTESEKSLINMSLYTDYYFVDNAEKTEIITKPHEYLIETVQELTYNVIPGMQKLDLNMKHLIKELVWIIRKDISSTTSNVNFVEYYDGSDNTAEDNSIEFSNSHTTTILNNLISENNIFIDDQTFYVPDGSGDYTEIILTKNTKRINPIIDPSNTEIDASGVVFNTDDIFTDFTSDSEITYIKNNTTAIFKSNNINIKKVKTTNITVNDEILNIAYGDGSDNVIVDGSNYVFENTTIDLTTNDISKGYIVNGTTNNCIEALIRFNDQTKIDLRPGLYYNGIQPYNHHKGNPLLGINCYSFSLYPEQIEPSGVCNFSRLNKKVLEINSAVTGIVTIMGFGYNVLKISSGTGGLLYN